MTSARTAAVLLTIVACSPLAIAQNAASSGSNQEVDPHKLVEIGGIEVNGTRLPKESIIRISELKVGQKANYDIINEACHRLTSTGLISMVDYAYNLVPGKPGVVLSLTVSDELPLLPARIYPRENEEAIWQCLQSADPIFAREMPNTRSALTFYAKNIDRCLDNAGIRNAYTHPTTVCDRQGKATVVVFDIRAKPAASASK